MFKFFIECTFPPNPVLFPNGVNFNALNSGRTSTTTENVYMYPVSLPTRIFVYMLLKP